MGIDALEDEAIRRPERYGSAVSRDPHNFPLPLTIESHPTLPASPIKQSF
jgi:hypothetical protein